MYTCSTADKCHEKRKSRQSKDKWRDKKSLRQWIKVSGIMDDNPRMSKVRQRHERWDSRKDGGSCTSCSMISMPFTVMPTRLNVFWEAMTNLARRTGSSNAKVYSLPSSDRSPQAHLLVSMHWSACCGYVKLGLLRVLLQDGQLYRYRYGTWYEQNKCNLCMFLSSPMKITQMLEHQNKSNGYRIPFILISRPPHSWDQHDAKKLGCVQGALMPFFSRSFAIRRWSFWPRQLVSQPVLTSGWSRWNLKRKLQCSKIHYFWECHVFFPSTKDTFRLPTVWLKTDWPKV